jgi:hypothetical protein
VCVSAFQAFSAPIFLLKAKSIAWCRPGVLQLDMGQKKLYIECDDELVYMLSAYVYNNVLIRISRVALRFWASSYCVPFQVMTCAVYVDDRSSKTCVLALQLALAVSRRVVSVVYLFSTCLCASLWSDNSTRLAHGNGKCMTMSY